MNQEDRQTYICTRKYYLTNRQKQADDYRERNRNYQKYR